MKTNKKTFLIALIALCSTDFVEASTASVGQVSVINSFEEVAPPTITPAFGLGVPNPANAFVLNNFAYVETFASSGQAGEARAYIGTSIDWDFQGLDPASAALVPVRLTVDYDYNLYADWTPLTGSGNAGVTLQGFDNEFDDAWYRFLGYATGETGNVSEHVVKTYTQDVFGNPLTVASFISNPVLEFQIYSWGHSDIGGVVNKGSASITLNSITVDTTPVPIPGAVWLFGTAIAGFIGIRRRS